jgi:hypothetical protein
MSSIYIPGHGEMSFEEFRIDRAVKAYDERLFFARNADTWDWCVYIRMPRPEPAYPVIGFGQSLPTVDGVLDRLMQADTMRVGNKIYDEVVRSQKDFKKQFEVRADEASAESAEVVEHLLRKHGKSPVIKSFSKGVSDNDA